jgi:hypothetical protein
MADMSPSFSQLKSPASSGNKICLEVIGGYVEAVSWAVVCSLSLHQVGMRNGSSGKNPALCYKSSSVMHTICGFDSTVCMCFKHYDFLCGIKSLIPFIKFDG